MIDALMNALGQGFIVIGLCFNVLGCIGLVRLPDVYNRLQASTKCVTLGTCGVMFGIFLIDGFTPTGVKALLVMVFLFLTSPTAAHALARAAYRSGVKLWSRSVVDYYKQTKDFQE